ncbi:FRAS1-related extracellular matrix protein 2-like [Penaeus monodon]|uniref:FRAS1-related extracellular matrix protein 2-like n=1 Tax=Penaeus monodon TaxID=6687 RepID=UPI0018A799D4|nr:FRAS1-related extracellular matrix protein 2-like [Penaeus monodon]
MGDVDERSVSFRLDSGVNETADSFRFSVEDKGGNHLSAQEFELNWSWISLEKELYEASETDKVVLVHLRRRGFLGETSFVTMDLQNGTALAEEDLHPSYARQVQFNPGQKEALWRLRLQDDGVYEGPESLGLRLALPVMAAVEDPVEARIVISDEEDVSRVSFGVASLAVEEDVGELKVDLVRSGDLSRELTVACVTVSPSSEDSATGTVPTSVLSYSDYITRADDPTSIVTFGRGESHAVCPVIVIDDSLQETAESFSLVLRSPMGGNLGDVTNLTVTIMPDASDEPLIFFGDSTYSVDESAGSLEVTVWRTGTDLSRVASVQVASKALQPTEAQAGYDYVAVGRQVDFPPGATVQTVRLAILDDLGAPTLEGPERLQLVLRVPVSASLGNPAVANVTIDDSRSDLPRFEFSASLYSGYESDGEVTAWISRSGDLAHHASVRCFTRQDTAEVGLDFDERPDTNASFVHFQPGEVERPCKVILVNDHMHEDDETLLLRLGAPASPSAGGALLGARNTSSVTIKDKADRSTIYLEETRVSVEEPPAAGEQRTVRLGVARGGDTSSTVAVRVHTKDGSAVSGTDYFGFSKELVFAPNASRQEVELVVLGDGVKEHREAFTVLLKADLDSASKVEVVTSKAIVYIEACDSKHPEFEETAPLCARQGINQTLSSFRWRVAAPSGYDGVSKDLKDVSSDTFFTSTRSITLDSVYFATGSRVQCVARAYSVDGDAGLALASAPVSIAREGGLCPPRYQGTFGADPFTAKLHYTGPDDEDLPNLVRVEVVIPHRDGMIPVLSTRALTNFELTLSRDGIRIGNHRCSNLLDFHEVRTEHGFLTNETRSSRLVDEVEPYQYSSDLRSPAALRFYRALDLESCLWRWVGYFTMSELVTQCGGVTTTDGQVLDVVQSYVSINVPLYVSYIFHSPVATGGWQHTDLTTHLRLSFVYDTSILWHQGIGAPATSELDGHLYPTAMRIREDGRLVVSFRTEARFRGIFVETHQAVTQRSSVTSEEHPDLTFTLELLRSQPTYAQPEQQWQFVSDFAVRDYSGRYKVLLLPCTVTEDVAYSLPLLCNPREAVEFDLQVRFQQVSDPVPEEFTLSTIFHLMRRRELWLSDLTTDFDTESDVSFYPGSFSFLCVDVREGRIIIFFLYFDFTC